jgi:hypothetical protein
MWIIENMAKLEPLFWGASVMACILVMMGRMK